MIASEKSSFYDHPSAVYTGLVLSKSEPPECPGIPGWPNVFCRLSRQGVFPVEVCAGEGWFLVTGALGKLPVRRGKKGRPG
jgi:hypothetical protein